MSQVEGNRTGDEDAQARASNDPLPTQRVWKLATALSILVAVASLAGSVWALRVARATARDELVIVDAKGRGRISLSADGEGPTFEMMDEDGRVRLSIQQHGDEVALRLLAPAQIHGAKEHLALIDLAASKSGNGILTIRDQAESLAELNAASGGALILKGQDNRVALSTSSAGASLVMQHQEERGSFEIWREGAHLTLQNGQSEAGLYRNRNGSSLVLRDTVQPGTDLFAVSKGPEASVFVNKLIAKELITGRVVKGSASRP